MSFLQKIKSLFTKAEANDEACCDHDHAPEVAEKTCCGKGECANGVCACDHGHQGHDHAMDDNGSDV